jgi:Chaperone of endosialidase/Head domain of trimeric autotransporter adhesin
MKKAALVLTFFLSAQFLYAQYVGIGTTTPQALLHVADSSVLFTGPTTIPGVTAITPPVSGAGTRLMWYPQKAAFRAGNVDGIQWNKDSIGIASIATGQNTEAIGTASAAFGFETVAGGNYSLAAGNNTKAYGLYSFTMGNASIALANNSIAIGSQNIASGANSFAMGSSNAARGINSITLGTNGGMYSTVIGYQNTTSGNYSIAMGGSNTASGYYSSAMGYNTKSKHYGGTVLGLFNDSLVAPDALAINPTNRIFQIGNGTADNARSNALTVLQNGKVGIGVTAPNARLQVADSSVLFTGPAAIPVTTSFSPPATGGGTRMMWYPQKAAFRVGFVAGTNWDKDSIGRYSFSSGYGSKSLGLASTTLGHTNAAIGDYTTAIGHQNFASGISALALGELNEAAGNYSIAMGYNSSTNGANSFAMGQSNTAQGSSSTALGSSNIAAGNSSVAIGANNTASGNYASALGRNSIASNEDAVAIGESSNANGINAIAIGYFNNASGNYSTALGIGNKAKSYGGVVVGMNNDSTNAADPLAVNSSNRIFQIGNGTTSNVRSNAMTVLQNGYTGIGTVNPTGYLEISSQGNTSQVVITQRSTVDNSRIDLKNGNSTGNRYWQISAFTDAFLNASDVFKFRHGVNGDILNLYGNGNATLAGTLTQSSDARLKTNIHRIQFSFENIKQINGYTYHWKDDKRDQNMQIGLLAQEIQKVYPELVRQDDKGMLSVNYLGLVPVLLEGIKAQQDEIEILKTRLEKLEQLLIYPQQK